MNLLSERGATFDATERYRYRLWRRWDDLLPPLCFVMLNPSTADGERDDPTVRRCLGYARDWGYGSLVVVNLFAYRAIDPRALRLVDDPVGPENDRHIGEAMAAAARVVFAWGAHGGYRGRDTAVRQLLGDRECWRLGRTIVGHPVHPLRQPRAATPERVE